MPRPAARALVLAVLAALASGSSPAQEPCCEVVLPRPFDAHPPADYVRLLHPDFDPATARLGPNLVDDEGRPLGGQLYDAKAWKAEGEPRLVVLVETYGLEDGRRPEYGAAVYRVDLLLAEDGPRGPRLLASLPHAATHTGHGAVDLDLAPYRLRRDATAVGLRGSSLHQGFLGAELQLFLREGTTFLRVFERLVEQDSTGASGDALEGDLDAAGMREAYGGFDDVLAARRKAILRVVPAGGIWNELEVVEQVRERSRDGRLRKDTVRERWAWDEAARAYRRSR